MKRIEFLKLFAGFAFLPFLKSKLVQHTEWFSSEDCAAEARFEEWFGNAEVPMLERNHEKGQAYMRNIASEMSKLTNKEIKWVNMPMDHAINPMGDIGRFEI